MFLILSTILIAGAGYVINDYYDVKIDIINKPGRLIVGRTLPRRYAMACHMVLTSGGIISALLINWKVAAINTLAAALLWWYSNYLKRTPLAGNVAVSLLTGLSVFMVSVLFKERELLTAVYAGFAFFMSLIREIIKDMEDLKGDKSFGCRTLPIKYGIRNTKKIIYVIEVIFICSLLFIGAMVNTRLLAIYILLIVIPMILFTYVLSKADTKKDFTYLSKVCKIIMICGILSMIFI